MTARTGIPVYFCHSYWREDREPNEFFWELFSEQGFAFTVDPKSGNLSIPQLQLMMLRSASFVAVATHRPRQERFRTSPFVVFEHGLAMHARKPRLMFLETGVAGHFFRDSPQCPFDRQRLEDRRDDFLREIERLRERTHAYASDGDRPLGSVGLILPRTRAYQAAAEAISDLLDKAGYEPQQVKLSMQDHDYLELPQHLDRHDFVILDIAPGARDRWVYPFVHGFFVPTIKLLHSDPGRKRQGPFPPPLVASEASILNTRPDELVIVWRDTAELLEKLELQVDKLQRPRRQFRSLEEGQSYFRSLGRSQGAVFISNPGDHNDFARQLSRSLDLQNIEFFHYLYRNTIELGTDWRNRLKDRLRSSRLFVPLISRAYGQSSYCMEEFQAASALRDAGRLTIYPYYLEDVRADDVPFVAPQGRSLVGYTTEEKIALIIKDVDEYLTPKEDEMTSTPVSIQGGPAHAMPVDVAIITVLKEEYDAVLRHLEATRWVQATPDHLNRYSWQFGEIASPSHPGHPYRVVLARAGEKGQHHGLLVVRDTVDAFAPHCVLLVGVAGGMGEARKGDVVVSSRIYGYEYGRLDRGFQPRPDWNHPGDTGVSTAADAMDSTQPDWSAALSVEPPSRKPNPPRIYVGPVASGDKVVDDLSDPLFEQVLAKWPGLLAVEMEGLGAADAIRNMREQGHSLNFSMVRGISDLPRSGGSTRVNRRSGRSSSQTRERDRWKAYAAEVAAVLVVQMIRMAWQRPPREE